MFLESFRAVSFGINTEKPQA